MPELPEVHTISTDLANHITGKRVVKVRIGKDYKVFPGNKLFIDSVEGTTIKNVTRIAKNILIQLDSDQHIGIHLAMTGRVLLKNIENTQDRWVKVILELKKDSGEKQLLKFTDMRMFGKVVLYEKHHLENLKAKYGPEPIDENISEKDFLEALQSKKTNVKNALLDQSLVSGLGNIYATDALFLAGIHPETLTTELNLSAAQKLLSAARKVLNEGIKNRGSTLPDKMYVDIFGKEGNQQKYFKIYMKSQCIVCNGKVEFKKINGRGTYFCPTCQVKTDRLGLLA